MYQIYSDNVCIYDDVSPDPSLKLVNPSWMQNANAAGSLEFSMPVTNAGYNVVKRLKSTIHLYKNGVEVWRGRVIQERKDFFNNRAITCEGALAFLNDTVIFLLEPSTESASDVLQAVLNEHNTRTDRSDSRKVYLGRVTNTSTNCSIDTSGGIKAIEAVSKLVSDYGGVIRTRIQVVSAYSAEASYAVGDYVRYDNDLYRCITAIASPGESWTAAHWTQVVLADDETLQENIVVLDWLAGYVTPQDPQSIEFGENLLDYYTTQDDTEYYTVLHAKGRVADPPAYEEEDKVITVSASQTVLNEFGRIEGIEDLSEYASTSAQLQVIAQQYLSDRQYSGLTLDVSVLDLHILNPDIRPFELLDKVSISSWAHGMSSDDFAITGITIPLDDPAKATFTIGSSAVKYYRKATKFTQRAADAEDVEEGIDEATREAADYTDEKTEEVAEQAHTELVTLQQEVNNTMNAMSQGAVYIEYNSNGTDAIYIISTSNYEKPTIASITDEHGDLNIPDGYHVWRWNIDGLGYTNSWTSNPNNWSVAMTRDGIINAERIQTGAIKLWGDMAVYMTAPGGGNFPNAVGTMGAVSSTGPSSTPTEGIRIRVFHTGVDGSFNDIFITSGGIRLTVNGRESGAYHVILREGEDNGVLEVGTTLGGRVDLHVNGEIYAGELPIVATLASMASGGTSNMDPELAALAAQMAALLAGEEEP